MSKFQNFWDLLKATHQKFQAEIKEFKEKKDKTTQIKTELKEKIQKELDLALAQLVNQP